MDWETEIFNLKKTKTMLIITLLNLIYALLFDLVLYYLGEILSAPEQLKKFLGLTSGEGQTISPNITSSKIESIGNLLKIIAIISAIVSIIGFIWTSFASRMF